MGRPIRHVLRVEQPVVQFAALIAALRQDGGRAGWLDLDSASHQELVLEPDAAASRKASPAVDPLPISPVSSFAGSSVAPGLASPAVLETLSAAADLGVLRAVAIGAEGSVAVKPRRGPVVLRDVLREHFRGCRLVLVRGGAASVGPMLRRGASDDSDAAPWWVIEPGGRFDTPGLVDRLRRPAPVSADPDLR